MGTTIQVRHTTKRSDDKRMVSRRNFITITLIMLLLLSMFQFSGVLKENWNQYDTNMYEEEAKNCLSSDSLVFAEKLEADQNKSYVLYVGNANDNAVGTVVTIWATYTKRRLFVCSNLEKCTIDKEKPPEVVLIDSNYVDWNTEVSILENMVDEGVNLIFCNLPPIKVIDGNENIKRLLGITFVSAPNMQLEGIKLFGGFLLGGEEWYSADNKEVENQDLNLKVPWYSVTSGTKTYMVGMIDKKVYSEVKNEFLPAIIWRNSIDKARIFVVNGDYLSTNTGIGILDAMMAELNEYEIYPIVNAQTIVALNYPVLADENNAEMMKRYSQSSNAVLRDLVWPGVISLTTRMNAKLTCMIGSQMNYMDNALPDADRLDYYFKIIREQEGEIGLSGTQIDGYSLEDKLQKDNQLFSNYLPNYKFTSFYSDKKELSNSLENLDSPLLQGVNTILSDYDEHKELAFYATKNVMVLNGTIDGFSHTFSEDLRVKSLETALGYSTIVADMKKVLYPTQESDEWQNLYEDFSRYTMTYWSDFAAFEKTTLTESSNQMRKFLAMDFSDTRTGDEIMLHVKNRKEEGCFLLRTHGESIIDIEGGSYEKIEEDAFLIRAKKDTVSIKVKNNEEIFYSN